MDIVLAPTIDILLYTTEYVLRKEVVRKIVVLFFMLLIP